MFSVCNKQLSYVFTEFMSMCERHAQNQITKIPW